MSQGEIEIIARIKKAFGKKFVAGNVGWVEKILFIDDQLVSLLMIGPQGIQGFDVHGSRSFRQDREASFHPFDADRGEVCLIDGNDDKVG